MSICLIGLWNSFNAIDHAELENVLNLMHNLFIGEFSVNMGNENTYLVGGERVVVLGHYDSFWLRFAVLIFRER